MSLRAKIVLILVTVVVAYAAIESLSSRYFTARTFNRWEHSEAREDLERVRQRLEAELADLTGKGRVLTGTKGIARFAAGEYADYPADNLGQGALERAGVDLFYLCAADGKVLWACVLDPDSREPMRLAEFPREALAARHPALLFPSGQEEHAGLLMTRFHPLLFATVPIPGADGRLFAEQESIGRTAAHGTLILGRFLGPALKQRIAAEELALAGPGDAATTLTVELLEAQDPGVPRELGTVGGEDGLYLEGDDGLLHAYQRMGAVRTDQPLVLHVALERSIEARRKESVNYLLLTTLIGGTLILLVLLRLLQHLVIAPLTTLTAKATEIGKRDDTTIRVGLERPDEIGQLAGEFDRMLEKLARSREQVVHTARLAGMSEIATGVLHNVGNVLNSVNVSANLATRRAEELALEDLQMLVGVLQGHERDLASFLATDPRGKHLVPFLGELSGALTQQRRAIQDELKTLNQGIEHIAELVRAQQSHAGTKGVFEHARLEEQVEAALVICRQGLGAGAQLEVVREFAELPSVRVDKHKLMEILVNLIQNACQAMAERGGPGQRLTLRIARDGEHARIEVHDTGVGIARENLTRVFHHGFTTKKDGHGFGLHVSANAATEMGAKLRAESAGPGRGATFVLEIPLEKELAETAA